MCMCPDCRHARLLRDAIENNEMEAVAIAWVAERYALDDLDARLHVWLHAINGPGVIQ